MKEFKLEITFCDRNIRVMDDKLDRLLNWWQSQVEAQAAIQLEFDPRQATKDMIVDTMQRNLHHTDAKAAVVVTGGALWLIADREAGKRALPFMRRGNMTVIYEIARVDKSHLRLRTLFDEDTQRAMLL